jgi:hypothetical protein
VGLLKVEAAAHVALFVNRAGNRDKHMKTFQGTFLVWLAALGTGKFLKGHLLVTRGRTCVRIKVHETKATALPAIGSQDSAGASAALAPSPAPLSYPPSLPFLDSCGHGARHVACR